jgi:hypothetical protein
MISINSLIDSQSIEWEELPVTGWGHQYYIQQGLSHRTNCQDGMLDANAKCPIGWHSDGILVEYLYHPNWKLILGLSKMVGP